MKAARRVVRRRLRLLAPPEVLAFRGFGSGRQMWIGGRVLEETGIIHSDCGRGPWSAFRDSVRRFRSHELPRATVGARFGRRFEVMEADEEGYFSLNFEVARPLSPGWHEVQLELIDSEAGGAGTRARAEVLIPAEDADFGIISDLDDTVIQTGATHLLRMVRSVLFKDAHGRVPFPGVSEFYRSLERGPSGVGTNPVFYVSRSPWNLYDLMERLLHLHDVPAGPLFLADLTILEARSEKLGRDQHKLHWIRKLFDHYPLMPFILIGDSGQEDPEIYAQIAREYPGRVRTIYIRDVTSGRRDREVHAIAEDLLEHGVEVVLVRDTEEAAEHARRRGFITGASLERVEHKAEEDVLTT